MESNGPTTANAKAAYGLVDAMQSRLVARLERVALDNDAPSHFAPSRWLRDGGQHGGGIRYGTGDTPVFNRASVNVSVVHYADEPDKTLSSATALSTIVHPQHPRAPSMHMHISWTEYKDGTGYWRMMSDLNPSMPNPKDAERFRQALSKAAGPIYRDAARNGDRYFYIPSLRRHRGVAHFYLEGHNSGDWAADRALAEQVGDTTISEYGAIVTDALADRSAPTDAERKQQLAYHSLYLLQVLTLDRGTTSGLLVHDQNDVGTMGSLPARVDRNLLASWVERQPAPQGELLTGLVAAIPPDGAITTDIKRALATTVRAHYRRHPEALDLQAKGFIVPATVANHI